MRRHGPALLLLGSLLLGAAWAGAESTRTAWTKLNNFNPPPVSQPVAASTPALTERLLWLSIDGLSAREANLMPTLQWLAGRGAHFDLTAPGPLTPASTSATLLTGAPPTVHGVMLPGRTAPLGTETILGVAARLKLPARQLGGPAGGPLPGAPEARAAALQAAAVDGLTLALVDDLAAAQRQLGLADPEQAEYRQAIAALDGSLLRLLEGIDLTKLTLVVTSALPTGPDGLHRPADRVLLIAAGPGVAPGVRGVGALTDVAPTLSTLLGLPFPAQSTGQPLLALLAEEGRHPEILTATYTQTRQTALQAALTSLGETEVLPAPPQAAAGAPAYVRSLERYIFQTERYLRVISWQERVMWPAIILLLALIYLVVLALQPIARAVWSGALLYLLSLPALFYLTGGAYAFLGAGLADWGRPALFRLAGIGLTAALLADSWTGYRLSRKGFKRGGYLALAGLHLHLLLVILAGLPLLIGWVLLGDALPTSLPSLPLLALLLALLAQIPLLGALSPLGALWTTFISRTCTRLWPLPEVGDPEVNADKVVRLRAIKRTTQEARRPRKG